MALPPVEVSATIGRLIVTVAAARGVDSARLCRVCDFDVLAASDPDARIPLDIETRLWDEAAEAASDPDFGLHAAETLRPGAFAVLDYAVRTTKNLMQSLERLARYNRLVHDTATFTIRSTREQTLVEHALPYAHQSHHAAEFTLASLVVLGSQLATEPLSPLHIGFRHSLESGRDLSEFRRVFGLCPQFGVATNRITLETSTLMRDLPHYDPVLSEIIASNAEALLAARPLHVDSLSGQLRQLLAANLAADPDVATLRGVAKRLRLSPRSLQRRLALEGTRFDVELDEVRRELAQRYLNNPRISIAEATYLLGYSEPSVFHRAHKRWTGITPGQTRRSAA